LFEKYIQLDALSIDTSRFLTPERLGCGEHFPRIETRTPGTESQDLRDADARLETNRRVEFLLIPPALVPNPVTCEVIYGNPDRPIVRCPTNPQPITITLHFTAVDSKQPLKDKDGKVIPLTVNITITGGATVQRITDDQGKIVLNDPGI